MTSVSPLKNFLLALATMLGLIRGVGCELPINPNSGRWHQKFGWKAKDYFTDAKLVELCNAIEKNDLQRMEQVIRDGANVNSVGKDGMTPLLWAFPGDAFERFECLLKHGADAGVPFKSDFNSRGRIVVGSNVAHLAAESEFPRHFIAIMKHGGNPDLTYMWTRGITHECTLFDSVFSSFCKNKKERCEALIKAGPSKSILSEGARLAVRRGDEYEIALLLLKAGADFRSYDPDGGRLVHEVAGAEFRSIRAQPRARAAYLELVKWLESQGEDFVAASADSKRWLENSRIDPSKGYAMRKADIAKQERAEKSKHQESN